jgi:hypothetical protein
MVVVPGYCAKAIKQVSALSSFSPLFMVARKIPIIVASW